MKKASRSNNAVREFLGLILLVITPMVAIAIPLDMILPASKSLAIISGIAILGAGVATAHGLNPRLLTSQKDDGPTLAEFTL